MEENHQIKPLILLCIIGLIIVAAGAFLFIKKPPAPQTTIQDGKKIAESMRPYLPKGYSIEHTAKQIDFPSGGTLFDTQLVNGEDKIGILLTPASEFECEAEVLQLSGKTICITELGTNKSIKWVKGPATYEVISTSVDLPMQELIKVVDSL